MNIYTYSNLIVQIPCLHVNQPSRRAVGHPDGMWAVVYLVDCIEGISDA